MKIIVLVGLLINLAGCSCSMGGSEVNPSATPSSDSQSSNTTKNEIKEAKDVVGEETQFGTPIVNLKMKEGKIIDIDIDEITDNGSKKDLGDEYKLSDTAIAPWYKQIEALEDYIEENGVEAIEVQEGKVVNEDLKSSVTINVENYIKTINKALNEAK